MICSLQKPKTRIKFSASLWSVNEKYFCFFYIKSRSTLKVCRIQQIFIKGFPYMLFLLVLQFHDRIDFWISLSWNFSIFQDSSRKNCEIIFLDLMQAVTQVEHLLHCLHEIQAIYFNNYIKKMPVLKISESNQKNVCGRMHVSIKLIHWDCNLAEINSNLWLFMGKVSRQNIFINTHAWLL